MRPTALPLRRSVGSEPSLPHISRHDRRANNTRKFIRIDWAPVQTRCTLLLPGCVSAREEMFRWKSLPPTELGMPPCRLTLLAPQDRRLLRMNSQRQYLTKWTGRPLPDSLLRKHHLIEFNSVRSLRVNVASPTDFAIVELFRGSSGHGMTEPLERAESYAACVHLDWLNDYDVWCDDRHISSRAIPTGAIHISDMRHAWRADVRSPFHVVNFYIPQAELDEFADDQGAPRIEDLKCPIDLGHIDPVLYNLARALLPSLARPDHTNRLFAEYASRAVTAHLVKSYGSLPLTPRNSQGGLAPWQERRAKEILIANLTANIGLSELASACRLSLSHFSHAFRRTVGLPPHQWLLSQRVDRAKQLLLNTNRPLCEIALDTGFCDQSHFTRIFSKLIGESPAAWRRAQE